jgi:L-seryl-tRNA(Ser) seleniumtransferase
MAGQAWPWHPAELASRPAAKAFWQARLHPLLSTQVAPVQLNPLRNIPSMNELLESPPLKGLLGRLSRNAVVSAVRAVLDETRNEVQTAAAGMTMPSVSDLAERIARRVLESEPAWLCPVINATGVLLADELGRAPLAEEAAEALAAVCRDYSAVELDLATGRRRRRGSQVEDLLVELTGAEAAQVVNNGAGALMLALAAVAGGREVIVARGQLAEFDESCRLPELVVAAGAVLHEVGTANRASIEDYARAVGPQTAALLQVHVETFALLGLSQSPGLAELAALGRRHKLPVIHHAGSAALVDVGAPPTVHEPLVRESLRAGADLVIASGDKMLGGPQSGIVLGRRSLVAALDEHPLARGLRVGKLTLAALAATLRLYRDPQAARRAVPVLHLLGTSEENLRFRAERLAPQLAAAEVIESAEAVAEVTHLGGVALPARQMGTWCVALRPAHMSAERLAARLRQTAPAVLGRTAGERLLFDLRSVMPRQDCQLVAAVEALGSGKEES